MEAKDLLFQLFSSISTGSILFDDKGVIFYANPSACNFLNSQENQLIGALVEETFSMLIDNIHNKNKNENGIVFDILNQNQQFELLPRQKLYFVSTNNCKSSVKADTSCFEIDGKKIGLILFRDIAKDKEYFQELVVNNTHMETVVDNLPVGFIEYDNFFCVKRINMAAENILGIKRDEILNLHVKTEDIHTERKNSLAKITYPFLVKESKTIKNKKNFLNNTTIHEMILDFPTKREVEVTTISLLSTKEYATRGIIKLIRDITKEKTLSQSKSDFLNIAAHQLKTPLSGIKWILNMIIGGNVGIVVPSQKKLLDKAYITNEKMILLVNNLLNVARIEDNRFGYVFKENNIIKAITDCITELYLMAEQGGVTLIFEKTDNIQPFMFDFSRIQLAIYNIINNAIKYTRVGGTVKISLTKKDQEIVVKIQDPGIGIPEDQMKHIFTKFFRAANVMRLQVSGSGLGLFIVKDIITRHGGTIGVKSIENKGTTFTIRLPMYMTAIKPRVID